MVRSQPLQIAAQQLDIPEHLWIVGNTPISRAVVRLAEAVNFHVSVFPHDQDALNKSVFSARLVSCTTALVLLEALDDQVAVLSHWLHLPLAFIGVAGNRERRTEIIAHLRGIAATRDQIERIHCPVGLPIGASSVEEAAIGIVAHLIQNRSDRRISHEAAARIKSPSLIKARA